MTNNSINTKNPLVQTVYTSTAAKFTCNVAIPQNDTIPQSGEGVEILTLAITPLKATNILKIYFTGQVHYTGAVFAFSAALFQDATANALAAVKAANTVARNHPLLYCMAAGTTIATTFKIRVGPTSGTCYVNANAAGALIFGGVSSTSLTIEEYMV